MRDVRRIREQIEIRLEPRQIAGLAMTTMLFSGGLFAAGFLLGQRQAASAAVAPPGADLARIDAASPPEPEPAPAHTPPAALGEVEFMFPSLLGSRPGRKRPPAPSVRLPAAVVAAPEPEARDVETEKPEPRAEKPEKKAAPKPKSAPEPKSAPAPKSPREKRARVKAPVAPETLDDAEDRPPGVAAKKKAPPKESESLRYTLQVKAVKSKADADALVDTLRAAGFRPNVVRADIPGHGRYYRVRVGRFGSMEEARAFQRKFKSKSGLPDGGFIIDL